MGILLWLVQFDEFEAVIVLLGPSNQCAAIILRAVVAMNSLEFSASFNDLVQSPGDAH